MYYKNNRNTKNRLERKLQILLYQSYLHSLRKAVSRKITSSSITVKTNFGLHEILLDDGSPNTHIKEIIIKLDGNRMVTLKVNTNAIKEQL